MALKLPRGLYALVDDGLLPEVPLARKAGWALDGGARVLQLRLERTHDRQALAVVREVVALARPHQAVVVVNDRVDWCLAGDADGVHLGDDDLPVAVARRLLGPERLIGRTTRTFADVVAAHKDGADHVGLGPIFESRTKQVQAKPLGLPGFAAIASRSPLPVVGIAGIGLESIAPVAQAGAHAAAVAGDWLLAEDPVSRVAALQRAFSNA